MTHLVIGVLYGLGLAAEVKGVMVAQRVALRRIRHHHVEARDAAVGAEVGRASAEAPTPHVSVTTAPETQLQIDQLKDRVDALEAAGKEMARRQDQIEQAVESAHSQLHDAAQDAAQRQQRDAKEATRAAWWLVLGPALAFVATMVWLVSG